MGSTLAASEANCVVELEVYNVVCYQSLDSKNSFLTVVPRRDVTGMEVAGPKVGLYQRGS
ncbi:hypothetical protein DIPPA_22554 [Diplonema papillatum]|nr:hypothetical protein DIPPA_22554 [Diplonema papillatum]